MNSYLIKAMDCYPYDLVEALENLEYALSYDDEDALAHVLMGRFLMEQLSNYTQAEHHYRLARLYDSSYVRTYIHYADLLIQMRRYNEAQVILAEGMARPGACEACFLGLSALVLEKQDSFLEAISVLEKAQYSSCHSGEIEALKEQTQRVIHKRNAQRSRSHSDRVSSSH